MEGKFLVSCCNARGGLVSVDLGKERVSPVLDGNTRGICIDGDHIWTAHNGALMLLDRQAQIAKKYNLKFNHFHPIQNFYYWNFRLGIDSNNGIMRRIARILRPVLLKLPMRQLNLELHDVYVYKNTLFVVMTKFNCIGIFEISRKFKYSRNHLQLIAKGHIRLHHSDTDRCHVNCIYATSQGLLITMFSLSGQGRDKIQRWAPVKDGGLVLISWSDIELYMNKKHLYNDGLLPYRVLCQGIVQPHSIRIFGECAYVCESFASRLWRVSLKTGVAEIAFNFPGGYIRGLHLDQECVVIGASATSNHPTSKFLGIDKGAGLWYVNKHPEDEILMKDWSFFSLPGVRDVYDIVRFSFRRPE